MRSFLLGALCLVLVACVQRQSTTTHEVHEGAGCIKVVTHPVTFSDATTPDTVTARADGPSCAQAVITLTIRNAAGDPLWAYASTYAEIQGGGAPPSALPASITADMDNFLTRWANVTVQTTGDLPEWREGVATLADSVQGLSYSTPFDRETYERLRGQKLTDLCFAAGAESSQCIIMDPASHQPSLMVTFGA